MPKKKKTARTTRQVLAEYEKLREVQKELVLELEKVSKKLKMCHFPSTPPFGVQCK